MADSGPQLCVASRSRSTRSLLLSNRPVRAPGSTGHGRREWRRQCPRHQRQVQGVPVSTKPSLSSEFFVLISRARLTDSHTSTERGPLLVLTKRQESTCTSESNTIGASHS